MSQSNLILPESVQRQRNMEDGKGEDKKPRFNLPPEMIEEIKTHIEEAKSVAEQVKELLSKGNAAQVALVCQEPIRDFLTSHIRSILPQLAQNLAHCDRVQILNFFKQVQNQRFMPGSVDSGKVDRNTYELAVSDFLTIISRVPAQVIPVEIGLPDLGLESQETETENIQPGE